MWKKNNVKFKYVSDPLAEHASAEYYVMVVNPNPLVCETQAL